MVRVNRVNGFVMMLQNRMKDIQEFTEDYNESPTPANIEWHSLLGAVREARAILMSLEYELSFDIQEMVLEPEED